MGVDQKPIAMDEKSESVEPVEVTTGTSPIVVNDENVVGMEEEKDLESPPIKEVVAKDQTQNLAMQQDVDSDLAVDSVNSEDDEQSAHVTGDETIVSDDKSKELDVKSAVLSVKSEEKDEESDDQNAVPVGTKHVVSG